MLKAMRTAVSGMTAQQMNVDNIANNLSNVNTIGFKRSRVEFQDVLYQNFRKAGTSTATGTSVPVSLDIGYGTKPVATVREFSVGDFQNTGNALDVAISGDGFFQIQMPDGSISYTRDGAFKMSAEGQIVNADGFYLYPEMTIPEDATSVSISIDGNVSVLLVGGDEPQSIGQFELARFINPAGLSAAGHNLYNRTSASGSPILGNPTQDGLGKLDQGYLEISNVKVVDEMVNMIVAQRAYELNSKVIQTGEDMLQISNNLKR
ncbi:MAG TPA: flagellar basal-body rod protein FlgG [candidate division Zixibacteria bacterium]|nr:flagellar basal-body rod protein FlgG [candidate division Zixibacteria bacterium]